MTCRPLAFGARFTENRRTVRLRQDPAAPDRYAVEIVREGEAPRVTHHDTLPDAVRRFSAAWRARLH